MKTMAPLIIEDTAFNWCSEEFIDLQILYGIDAIYPPLSRDPIIDIIKCLEQYGIVEKTGNGGISLIETSKYVLRKIFCTSPEIDKAIAYLRRRGVSTRSIIVPGPIYLSTYLKLEGEILLNEPDYITDVCSYIVVKVITTLTMLGYNHIMIYEPGLYENFSRMKRGYSFIEELYNIIVGQSDAELYSIYVPGKPSTTLVGALAASKIDIVSIEIDKYNAEELETIVNYIASEQTTLSPAIIGYNMLPINTYVTILRLSRRIPSLLNYISLNKDAWHYVKEHGLRGFEEKVLEIKNLLRKIYRRRH